MSDPALNTPVVEAWNLTRTYTDGPTEVHALRDVHLAATPGSVVVVQGRSGSGKTTLLNLLGGLDNPTAGSVSLDGEPLHTMGEIERSVTRRIHIGFIFQSFGLLPGCRSRSTQAPESLTVLPSLSHE